MPADGVAEKVAYFSMHFSRRLAREPLSSSTYANHSLPGPLSLLLLMNGQTNIMPYPSSPLILLLLVVVSSCTTVGPDYTQPKIQTPKAWSKSLQSGVNNTDLAPQLLSHWWTSLGDSILDHLIERAIMANLDLRTAQAQLRQARAQRASTGSTRFPTVITDASASRSGRSENANIGGNTELYSVSFDASWEVDIFGGRRRLLEAAEADYQIAQESRRDVLVSVLAEVALSYIELRTFQAQLTVAEKNLRNQEKVLGIVQAQYDAGAVAAFDLDRAVSNVANTQSELPRLQQNISQAKHRLAVLLGQAPGALESELATRQPLPIPPSRVAVGIPAETLRRRPDVRRTERRLAAETARVGVAVAELYPKFTLSGTIGLEALSLGNLIAGDSRTFGLGPSVRWNLFDGGRARRQIEIQNAVQEQAMIQYEASILNALEEVENAITALTQEQLRYRSLKKSSEAAQRAANIAQIRYQAGASNFLTVLDAQRSLLSAEDRQAASEGAIASNLVRLYKSLGGGWMPAQPKPKANHHK